METKICSKCKLLKSYDEFNKSKRNKTGIRFECKECQKICYIKKSEYYKNRRKKRYNDNKTKELIRNKKYYKKNKKEIIEKLKLKKHNNLLKKIISNLRSRLCQFLKSKKIHKDNETLVILGISLENFKEHLQNKFTEGMSWDNYGFYGWHIDHIIPLSSAKSKDEVYKLCHYTNLQPLWCKENLSKGDKIII